MYKIINNPTQLLAIGKSLADNKALIALDTETEGLFIRGDKVVGFSFSWKAGVAAYVPVSHKSGTNCTLDAVMQFFELIKNCRVVFHNAQFDRAMIISTFGKNIPMYADTMMYAALLSEPKGLKDLSKKYLNVEQTHFKDLMKSKFGPSWKKKLYNFSYLDADDPDMLNYVGDDADYTLQLFHILKPRMKPYKSILKIEENIADTVVRLNLTGCPIDKSMLEAAVIDYEKSAEQTYRDLVAIAGRDVSVNSSRDLGNLLFCEQGLPVIKRSKKTGAPSASKEVLEELSGSYPIAKLVNKYRAETKLLNAYLKKIPDGLSNGNRIFSEFDNLGAVSGRFTSSGVTDSQGIARGLNLQSIPKKGHRKIDMRKAFVAPDGWTFVRADYSQVEYRVMANLSQEPYLIDAFRKGVDFHTFAAHSMYDIPIDQITPEQRKDGKVFNFGLSYGMSAHTLAKRLGVSEEIAQNKITSYFNKVPRLVSLIDATKEKAIDEQRSITYFGRTRSFMPVGTQSWQINKAKDAMLRMAFNTMIQGTAADILKIAILRLEHNLLKRNPNIKLVLTVHDEVCLLVKNEYLHQYLPLLKRSLEIPVPANWVPFVSEVSYGPNWSEETHTKYDGADMPDEKFTSWAGVMPQGLKTSIDDLI